MSKKTRAAAKTAKSGYWGDVVDVREPSGVVDVNVENGMIYVTVYAKGDTPMQGDVYAVSHTTSAPADDPHNIGSPLGALGLNLWGGCIPAPLGNFYVTACAEFLNDDDPMTTHHVPHRTVQLNGVEGDEPRCGMAQTKAKKPAKKAKTSAKNAKKAKKPAKIAKKPARKAKKPAKKHK